MKTQITRQPAQQWLRSLLEPSVSLERAVLELNAAHFRGRVAQSVVESLMYSLRERGIKALDEPDTQRRISELSEEQLHDVGARLQALKIVRAWTAENIEQLVAAWMACRA
jgi:hypothetical protein